VTEAEGETEGASRPTWRVWAGLSAPVLALGVALLPLGLPDDAHRLAAIFVMVIVLWVTEAIPIAITALLVAPMMVAAGITDAKTAFAPYADPLLFLFVGGFMIAKAMTRHGLDRRIAFGLVSLPFIAGMPSRVRGAFMLAAVLLSMWISNTATAAILVPMFIGLFDREEIPGEEKPGSATSASGGLLAIAYAASIGGLGTPVGSPPNLIAMRFLEGAGHRLSFLDWMKIGLPTALVLTFLVFLYLQRRSPPVVAGVGVAAREAGPWSRGELVTAAAFGVAVVGWMTPGIMEALEMPDARALAAVLPEGAVAMFAASILYMVPDRGARERVLPWREGVKIDWGIIMLFGGGISLGKQLFDTGLAEAMSRGFVALTGVDDLWTLTAIVTVFTIFFTETCSNTATSNMLSPLVIAVANELQISPVPPVLAVGLAASCAFMLPIATGPNAVVYGSGRVTQTEMIKAGFWLNVVAAILILILLRLLCPLYGWV
jgi:solute carrier family 13 (sodium-dependent dicarboxylate transporter), member 2/3/5